ncbi:MAG: hypothetical protein KAR06_03575 [Deltaproteobacteria bacterium]|nr:hypothetical protein [Deltaproteobacteria bacterium]
MIFEIDGVTVVQFGHGSVLVMPGKIEEDKHGTLSLGVLDPPQEIGWEKDNAVGKTDKVLGAKVRLVFTNLDGLNVLIEDLQKVKETMINFTAIKD